MKTKEELSALKAEVTALNQKLAELSAEELTQVTGGFELPGFHYDFDGNTGNRSDCKDTELGNISK